MHKVNAILAIAISLVFSCSLLAAQPAEGDVAAAESLFEPHLKADEKVVHPPYEWGDCTVCHTDAKGEEGLVSEPPELCYMCHAPKDDKKFIHGPVAAGACTACHNPHESENKIFLTVFFQPANHTRSLKSRASFLFHGVFPRFSMVHRRPLWVVCEVHLTDSAKIVKPVNVSCGRI